MGVIHIRAVSPPHLTDRIVGLLTTDPYAVNLIVLRGAVREPDGDSIECDVLSGAGNEVLRRLRELELDQHGSIVVEPVELAIAGRAAHDRLSLLATAPVWEIVESRIRAQATYPPSFYLFLVIAGVIATVGILTNSQILIVAAMVVGPEYNAIVSVALGLERGRRNRIGAGLLALLIGFTLAVLASYLFGLLTRGLGLQPEAFTLGIRPVSHLIDTPNFYSLVVAVLAGIVGVVALTEARTSALLGVFISVTTIPAAADMGLAASFDAWDEAWGSLLQLLLNIVVLILVGSATLRLQRVIWRRIRQRRQPRPG